VNATSERVGATPRRADLFCCVAFAACSAAGFAWFWLTAAGPTLAAW
jgi:hypothetical protein